MFNKIYNYDQSTASVSEISLAFLKSTAVKTFPSGRRRSTEIDQDGNPNTEAKYYIPFDPEARLNTEANSRKYSSLNGYTQTYLKEWDIGSDAEGSIRNGRILLSLYGYLFDIELISLKTQADFGAELIRRLKIRPQEVIESASATEAEKTAAQSLIDEIDGKTSIYANIILEDVPLYSSSGTELEYYTSILRDQLSAGDISPSVSLDLLNIDESNDYNYASNLNNYYFSGLSFSVEPLVNLAENETYNSANITGSRVYGKDSEGNGRTVTFNQQVASLRLLRKVDGVWEIHQPAFLPKIEHGTTEDSIIVYGDTTIKSSEERPTKLLVEGTAEVNGDTTIHSNLKVDDNINVGNLSDAEKATGDNGGNIVAKNDITAKHDLKAENDLSIGNDASIAGDLEVTINTTLKTSLVVGERANDDSTTAGDLTVKNHIKTPTIEATISVTTPQGNITKADISTADIDEATIKTAAVDDTATDTLEVNAKATINEADIETADITTLTGKNATIEDIVGTNTVSSANMYQAGYKVPIIELAESGEFWQLKISRIGTKPQD